MLLFARFDPFQPEVAMLSVEVKLLSNPWEHSVPTSLLYDLLNQVGESRAKHVEKQYNGGNGEWPRDSLGLALMIPNAPRRRTGSATRTSRTRSSPTSRTGSRSTGPPVPERKKRIDHGSG